MAIPRGIETGKGQYTITLDSGSTISGYNIKPESKASGILATALSWLKSNAEDYIQITIKVTKSGSELEQKVWVLAKEYLITPEKKLPSAGTGEVSGSSKFSEGEMEELDITLGVSPEAKGKAAGGAGKAAPTASSESKPKAKAASGGGSSSKPMTLEQIFEAIVNIKLQIRKEESIIREAETKMEKELANAKAASRIESKGEKARLHVTNYKTQEYLKKEAEKRLIVLKTNLEQLEEAKKRAR